MGQKAEEEDILNTMRLNIIMGTLYIAYPVIHLLINRYFNQNYDLFLIVLL